MLFYCSSDPYQFIVVKFDFLQCSYMALENMSAIFLVCISSMCASPPVYNYDRAIMLVDDKFEENPCIIVDVLRNTSITKH